MYSYIMQCKYVWEAVLSGGFTPLGTEAVHDEDWMHNVQLYSEHVYGKQFYLEDLLQSIQVPEEQKLSITRTGCTVYTCMGNRFTLEDLFYPVQVP
jgi:hypothetical protein